MNALKLSYSLNKCGMISTTSKFIYNLWEVELLENPLRATSYSNVQMKYQCCHVYARPSRKIQTPPWISFSLWATTKNRIHIDICCPLHNYQVAHAKLMIVLYQEQVVEGIPSLKSNTPSSHQVLSHKEVLFQDPWIKHVTKTLVICWNLIEVMQAHYMIDITKVEIQLIMHIHHINMAMCDHTWWNALRSK